MTSNTWRLSVHRPRASTTGCQEWTPVRDAPGRDARSTHRHDGRRGLPGGRRRTRRGRGRLDRVRIPCAYARSEAAAGRGTLHGEWLGIYELATLPEARRRGAASAIVGALAAWGAARGARPAYLMVEEGNAPAHAMYARLGIRRAYGYSYRVREPGDR